MTIREAFNRFIYDRSTYCAPPTLKKYSEDVLLFFQFLEKHYSISVDLTTFSDLKNAAVFQDFIIYLRTCDIRNSSIRSYCRSVKTFLRFCYEQDFCLDYLKNVRLPRDDSVPKIPLYTDEVYRIDSTFNMKSVKGIRNYCIVHLMLDCGLRRQEVIHLDCSHLDFDRNIVMITDSKGNKSRFVLIPDFLLNSISVYQRMSCRASGILFLSLKDDKPLTDNTVKMFFQDLKAETQISRLHPHLLRHTFATSYLMGGGNLEFLRVFMGHCDYTVTKTYSSMAAQFKMLGADIYKLDDIFFRFGY